MQLRGSFSSFLQHGVLALAALTACAFCGEDGPEKPPAPKAPEKPKGPEHNVGLNEDPAVTDLFNRAKKTRARAEANPEAWPECVKIYLEILKKHRNSVYLDRWEGPDNSDPAFKNGLYKSARERALAELATLPPAALAVYRAIAEPAVRALYFEAREKFDAHKMEELARDYPLTQSGAEAQAWLAEYAFERGAWKDATVRFLKLAEKPVASLKPTAALARAVLAQIHAGDKEGATKTLAALTAASASPEKGILKIGADEGAAALAKLQARITALEGGEETPAMVETRDAWPTFYGNAAHNQVGQARTKMGLRKWSLRLDELLYGPGSGANSAPGNPLLINSLLTIQDGIMHLNDERAFVGYPINDPHPGSLKEGGDALYRLPSENLRPLEPPAKQDPNNPFMVQQDLSANMVEHPMYTTLAGNRWFGVMKNGEAPPLMNPMWAARMRGMMGGNDESTPKQPLNFLTCFGRAGAAKEPAVLWSLKPGEPAFNALAPNEQEWLRSIGVTNSPMYDGGILYFMGVTFNGSAECSVAAVDAESGRLLWTTQVCSGTPIPFGGMLQPDRGVPLTVSNGIVYALTNLGAVAALDAGTGEIQWIRVYDRLKTHADQFNQGESVQVRDVWAPNPPLVVDNRLIVAPQDSDMLYAYDLQTGARVWEIPRRTDRDNFDERGTRYVLGIINGVLVVTGADIRFVKVKSGKRIAAGPDGQTAITPESPIVGRGTVTAAGVLVSTEKGLLQIDIANDGENVVVGKPRLQEWADGNIEAGNVLSVGGMLYTVSHTHVNSYFIWEEMEAQLRKRLEANPKDKRAHIELADIYSSLERYDDALTELDLARKNLGEADAQVLTGVARRGVEALIAHGNKLAAQKPPDPAAAAQKFNAAMETVRSARLPEIFAVRALQALADAYEAQNKLTDAAQTLQTLAEKYGAVEYQFEPHNAVRARVYAQHRLAVLRGKDPQSYALIEKSAADELAAAGNDPKKLNSLSENYPASDSAGRALLILGRADLEKSPDRARLAATRFLSRHAGADKADGTAQALALLTVANERLGFKAAAKSALRELAGDEAYKDAKLTPSQLETGAAAEPVSAQEWANKRLQAAEYQIEPSRSALSLGSGKLHPLWAKANVEKWEPLRARGVAPLEMRRAVLFVQAEKGISAISGLDGEEVWKTSAPLPTEILGAWWHERLLLVFGKEAVAAFDSGDGGLVWTRQLKGPLPLTQVPTYAWRASSEGVFFTNENVLMALDPGTGQQLWTVRANDQYFNASPVVGRHYVACANVRGNKLLCFDPLTGAPRWNVPIEPLSAPLAGTEERIYAPLNKGRLRVLATRDGKTACPDIEMTSSITGIREAGDNVVFQLQNGEVGAFRWMGDKPGPSWRVSNTVGESVADFTVDGDDLLVLANVGDHATLACYSLKGQGKLRWRQSAAVSATRKSGKRGARNLAGINGGNIIIQGGGQVVIQNVVINGRVVQRVMNANNQAAEINEEPGSLLDERLTREHVLNLESNWDVSGEGSKIAVLVDRVTGKAIWDTELRSETLADLTVQPAEVQLFDGGLVLSETRGRSAFGVFKKEDAEERYEDLKARAAANPADFNTRRKLAEIDFHQGKAPAALAELAGILADPRLEPAQFAGLYRQYAELRREFAAQQHMSLTFKRVDKAPALDGDAGWEQLAPQKFEGFADVYQGSEDPASRQDPVKELWHGASDLSAVFKGAYDDKNLYISIDVTDDIQRNDQSESAYLELGDSLTLAFDIGLSGGMGYRGETFEMSLGIKKGGAAAGWRKHEHGRYLRGNTPLENLSVTRLEDRKLTRYRVALPLDYLGLKPDSDKPFGFAFAVHDQDTGAYAEKHLCSSPGLVGIREPRYFSRGTLVK